MFPLNKKSLLFFRHEKTRYTCLVTSARLQMELVIFTETFQVLPEVQAFTSNNSKTYKTVLSKAVLYSCFNQLLSHLSYAFMRSIAGNWSAFTLTSSLPAQNNVMDHLLKWPTDHFQDVLLFKILGKEHPIFTNFPFGAFLIISLMNHKLCKIHSPNKYTEVVVYTFKLFWFYLSFHSN